MICPTGKAEYFCEQDWTGRIALICFNNLAFTRNGPQAAQTRSPDAANRSRGCAPDDRLRAIRESLAEAPDSAALHPGYGQTEATYRQTLT